MATTYNNLLIAFFDRILAAVTPTANFTPATGYPLSNLTNAEIFRRCRTPDLTADRQLTWDMGSALSGNIFGLIGTNATISVTRRFRAATDSGFTTGVTQSGAALDAAIDNTLPGAVQYAPPWGRTLLYIHPQTFTARYLRWHQTDASNLENYQEWGIAGFGQGFQSAGGFISWRKPLDFPAAQGILLTKRSHEVTIHNMTKAEKYALEGLLSVIGVTRRVLVVPEPSAPGTWQADAIWARCTGSAILETKDETSYGDKRFSCVLKFQEVVR